MHSNRANAIFFGAEICISWKLFFYLTEFIKIKLTLLIIFRYSENAKIVSERFKDRPMSPAELVVYWTEYVIRHKGAPHLKSHALNLTWYQYFLLDIISAVLFVTLLVSYVVYKAFKCTKQLICKLLSKRFKSKPE